MLHHIEFSGSTMAITDVFDQALAVPGPGTALLFVDRTFAGAGALNVYLNPFDTGGTLFNTVNFDTAGSFTVRVELTTGTMVSVTGHVTVLFIPD